MRYFELISIFHGLTTSTFTKKTSRTGNRQLLLIAEKTKVIHSLTNTEPHVRMFSQGVASTRTYNNIHTHHQAQQLPSHQSPELNERSERPTIPLTFVKVQPPQKSANPLKTTRFSFIRYSTNNYANCFLDETDWKHTFNFKTASGLDFNALARTHTHRRWASVNVRRHDWWASVCYIGPHTAL